MAALSQLVLFFQSQILFFFKFKYKYSTINKLFLTDLQNVVYLYMCSVLFMQTNNLIHSFELL